MRTRTLVSAVVMAMVCVGAALGQTTVVMRSSVRLAEDAQVVRIADIALVSGESAAEIGDVVVRQAIDGGARGWVSIDLAEVRAALEAHGGINWGRLALRGGACTLRTREAKVEPSESRTPPVKGSRFKPVDIDLAGAETVKTLIARRMGALYGVELTDLRLGFDPADDGVLGTLAAGRTVDIEVGAVAGSARAPIAVTIYDGERVVLARTVQVDVEVRREVVTAAGVIERGRVVTAADLATRKEWAVPRTSRPGTVEDVVGSIAQKRIAAGQPVGRDDVTPPLACKRGDTVYIHCLSGGIVVKAKAKALGSARDGELVELRVEGGDTPVLARMSGRGRAVMVVDVVEMKASQQRVYGGSAGADQNPGERR
jgi:flagella basal body P-ring formation protein FlgA